MKKGNLSTSRSPLPNVSHGGNLILLRRKNRDSMEMDITPMIDITFLLLIFFIVCSSLDQAGTVQLPPAYFGTAVNERNSTVLTVDGSGMDSVVYLGGGTAGTPLSSHKETQEREIVQAIEAGFQEGKTVVVIRASGDLYRAEVHRIESAVGTIPNVKTIHIAVKETK